MNRKVWIVYFVRYKSEVVYIGSGVRGREKHTTSGVSHVYELNKLHFAGEEVDVTVVKEFTSKEASLSFEMEQIKKHRPTYNKVHNNTEVTDNMTKYAIFKADTLKWVKDTNKLHRQLDRYTKAIKGLFSIFGAKSLYDGVCIYGYSTNKHTRPITECYFKGITNSTWSYILNLVEISVREDGKPWLRIRGQEEVSTMVVA